MKDLSNVISSGLFCLLLVMSFGSQVFGANVSLLGDQDYVEGAVISSNGTWLTAQAGEPYPFNTIHAAFVPTTVVWTHTGLDVGREGILTFSLWDLDAEFSENQVVAFSFDGTAQPVSAFEIPDTDLKVREFQFLVDPSFLSDGELVVSITFSGPPSGNEVGIDFSRLEVPEPEYVTEVLFDQSKAYKSGSTVPVRVRLLDTNAANVSAATITLHAVSVVQVSSQASTTLDDAGNSNPDFDFRYDPDLAGYIFNLKTTGYGTGTYILNFVVGNGSDLYSVGFQVRQ